MQFDFLEKLQEIGKKPMEEKKLEVGDSDINQTEIELAKKLDAVQEFSVDRFEEDIAVLENRKDGNIINVEKNKLPNNVKEGDILKCINSKYFIDEERTSNERNRIQEKMNDLWN